MPSSGVRLSVRLSVKFVYSVETNKRIIKHFSAPGGHAILVFFVLNFVEIFRREAFE